MPHVSRNRAARRFYEELQARYPTIDRAWMRGMINEIAQEEIRLIERDLMVEIRSSYHYHVGSQDPEQAVISAKPLLRHIKQRLEALTNGK